MAINIVSANEVELAHSLTTGQMRIDEISALRFSDDGSLLAVDRKLGLLTLIKEGGVQQQMSLGGGKVFNSNALNGVSLQGNTYILSSSQDAKIAFVDHSGKLLSHFGEKGNRLGMLNSPQQLDFSINERLYVADPDNDVISIFNRMGVFLSAIGNRHSNPDMRLDKPTQVAVDALEQVYVLVPGSSANLSIYAYTGELIKRYTAMQLGAKMELTALAVDPSGRVFLADSDSGKILQYDWQNNKVLMSFGSEGEGPGQYKDISALAVSTDNKLAVADSRNKKIDVYQLGGELPQDYERAWLANVGRAEFMPLQCTAGFRLHDLNILCLNDKSDRVSLHDPSGKLIKTFSASFKNPTQAAYDDEAIAILNRNYVMVLDHQGNLLTQFGGSGSNDGELRGAEDIDMRDGKIYIAESSNQRVQIFSMKGVYLDKFPQHKGSTVLQEPVSIAVDANSNFYVADSKKQKILVFSKEKKLLYEIGEPIGSPAAFKEITDLALDTDNNLYVLASTELNAQTVQVFSGPKRIFEFGSSSKKEENAIAAGSAISIAPQKKTLVSIFDSNSRNPGLLTFNYLQVPARVGGVVIYGGVKRTRLEWQAPPGNYIDSFRIYAAMQPKGPFEYIKQVEVPYTEIEHEAGKGHKFYKISALSGFGVEGPHSNMREDIFQSAYVAYQVGQYEQALDLLRKTLQESVEHPEAIQYSGLSYLHQNKPLLAFEQFKLLGAIPGYEKTAGTLQVEALFENGDYTDAMTLVQEIIKSDEGNVDSYILCGKLSLKMGDPIGAVSCMEDAGKIDPNNAQIYFLLGQAYVKVGALDNGVAEIEKAIAADAQNPEIWMAAGELYTELGKLEIAKQKYDQALQLDANNTRAQLGLAKVSMELGDLAAAKNIAIRLAGKKESEADGHYLLGRIALKDSSYGEAIIALGRATRSHAEFIDAWLALADAYQYMQQNDKTLQTLQQASQSQAAGFIVYKRLGLMLRQQSRHAEAASVLDVAAELQSNDAEVRLAAAEAHFSEQKYASAYAHGLKAIELDQQAAEPLLLMARITHARGKTGAAIEYAKSAIALKSGDAEIHTLLGEFYLENNLYDEAQASLEKAIVIDKTLDRPHVLLGRLFSNRYLFDKAIKAFEVAVKLNGSAENRLLLDSAYADKKKSLDFSQNAPRLVLEDLQLDTIFSAAYKQYNDKPIGRIKVRNASATDYGNLQVSFEIKGYMDFPTMQTITQLPANGAEEVTLLAAFNNKVLEIDEDTGVQVEVRLNYVREGRDDSISITRPMTLYGKNAIVWNNSQMVGSFVTPKDDALRDFVRRAVNEYKPERGPLSDNLVTAMTIFDTFSALGVKYSVDPTNPFAELKGSEVDYVQFARETIKLKSGDCDDLSVLLSASLENLGVETALLDVPGHLLMMFNTTIPTEEKHLISGQDDLLVIHGGKVWIPLEATMMATSFTEAWAEGAHKYYQYSDSKQLKIIMLHEAWQTYPPVTLAKSNFELQLPDKQNVLPLVAREQRLLLEKGLARLVMPYRAMVLNNPKDTVARMQIAIIYARYGLYERANEELDALQALDASDSAVYNNRGNIYYSRGDYQRAYEAYSHAERLDVNDAGIKLNIALVLYQEGKLQQAQQKYGEAEKLNADLLQDYVSFSKLLHN